MIRLLTISTMFIQHRRVIIKLKTSTFKYNIYLFPMNSADVEIFSAIFRFDCAGSC